MKRQRKVQLSQIAARVGVSTAGVSLALRNHPRISEATRLRVQRVARELGYQPKPRKSATNTIRRFGFVYCDPGAASFNTSMFEPAIQLFMRNSAALRARFELLLLEEHDLELASTAQKLTGFAANLEGILLFGMIHAPMLKLLNELGQPAVVVGESGLTDAQAQELKLQRVTDDPLRAGRLATEYLLARGRRQIAFLSGTRQPKFFYDAWYRGFLHAHAEAGVPVSPRLVMWHEQRNPLRWQIPQLFESEGALPDAIVWPDASMSAGYRPMLHERGLVLPPEDEVIAAMSHASELAGQEHYPQILSDLAAMTEEAIRRLHAVCRDGATRATTIVIPNLIRNMNA